MPITYKPPVNYQSPMTPIPSTTQTEPHEGRMTIPVEVLWGGTGAMGGADKVVGFDFGEDGACPMRQIAAVIIDNSACTVPVTLIFPDTLDQIVIPANAKRLAINVYTNGQEFVMQAPTAIATDITRMQLLNYRIPPVYIP